MSTARLFRQGQEAEVLLLEPAQSVNGVTWQVLATWSPPEKTDFILQLLAADGTVCEQQKGLTLGPGDAP